MKNLSIFEPQIEKHYAYKETCISLIEICVIRRLSGYVFSERGRASKRLILLLEFLYQFQLKDILLTMKVKLSAPIDQLFRAFYFSDFFSIHS